MSVYKRFTHVVAKVPVPALIQTTSQRIKGTIYVRQGYRVSDTLREEEDFLAVTDAVVLDGTGREILRAPFLAVNKAHIVWVFPEQEDLASEGEEIA